MFVVDYKDNYEFRNYKINVDNKEKIFKNVDELVDFFVLIFYFDK